MKMWLRYIKLQILFVKSEMHFDAFFLIKQ
jgi:hypothetical protein